MAKSLKTITFNNSNMVKIYNQFYKLTTSTVKILPKNAISQSDNSKRELKNEYLYDKLTEIIAKRVILEFKNNDKIFLAKRLSFLIENLYRPNHINIDFQNSEIIKFWPSNIKWANLVSNLDICIVEVNNVNKNAEIQLDLNKMDDIIARDIACNLRKYSKLIAIIHFNQDNERILYEFDKNDKSKFVLERRADLIISNKGVFVFCEKNNRLEMIEYIGNFDHRKPLFDSTSFQPFIDKYSVKAMPQECI